MSGQEGSVHPPPPSPTLTPTPTHPPTCADGRAAELTGGQRPPQGTGRVARRAARPPRPPSSLDSDNIRVGDLDNIRVGQYPSRTISESGDPGSGIEAEVEPVRSFALNEHLQRHSARARHSKVVCPGPAFQGSLPGPGIPRWSALARLSKAVCPGPVSKAFCPGPDLRDAEIEAPFRMAEQERHGEKIRTRETLSREFPMAEPERYGEETRTRETLSREFRMAEQQRHGEKTRTRETLPREFRMAGAPFLPGLNSAQGDTDARAGDTRIARRGTRMRARATREERAGGHGCARRRHENSAQGVTDARAGDTRRARRGTRMRARATRE